MPDTTLPADKRLAADMAADIPDAAAQGYHPTQDFTTQDCPTQDWPTPDVDSAPVRAEDYARDLPLSAPLQWLALGVRDCFTGPATSLAYGCAVMLLCWGFIAALVWMGFSYLMFPVIAGFMVVGPVVATGLYAKSRYLASRSDHSAARMHLLDMIRVRPKSPGPLLAIGVMQMLVMTFWLRAAVMLYALFFGLSAIGGPTEIAKTLLFTDTGRGLLITGSLVGSLFAAFSFGISVFSIPMLLAERKDTLTAMALSIVMAWMNRQVVMLWGLIVLTLSGIGAATGFLGMILVFPILGHASWHAYVDIRGERFSTP